ncbi:hypothetical protein D3C74_388960 [compost metagenome]
MNPLTTTGVPIGAIPRNGGSNPIEVATTDKPAPKRGIPTNGIINFVFNTIGIPKINGSFIPNKLGTTVNFPNVL